MALSARTQRGLALAYLMFALAIVGIIGGAAFNHYLNATKANSINSYVIETRNLLAQSRYALIAASADVDGDGAYESPAMVMGSGAPSDGGLIPTTAGAALADAAGISFGYCAWDNGAVNSSTNRITGSNPATQSNLVFAIISAGQNHVIETTCANVLKGSTGQGDDTVVAITAAQVAQGVGGTLYYGDPVADTATLNSLPTSGLKTGTVRLVTGTNTLYMWNGSSWTPVNGSSGSASPHGKQLFTSNGTFTVPSVSTVWVSMAGGGGGGGTGAGTGILSAALCAGGGGGGAQAYMSNAVSVTAGASIAITVGAGGKGGAAGSATAGSNGGSSSFGTLLTAAGGTGGGAGWLTSGNGGTAGGAGGATGETPDQGCNISVGGAGGGSIFGAGSAGGSAGNGMTGAVYGSGGGGGAGGVKILGYTSGGAGAQGFVLVEW